MSHQCSGRLGIALGSVWLLSAPLVHAQAMIGTYAGTGRTIQAGTATSAILDQVDGLATDAAGNVYAAVSLNHVVIMVTPAGVLKVLAGNGSPGFSGDGGPATAAALNLPNGVAVDGKGNLYIVDGNNARVRKVDPSGIITTFAGSGDPNSYDFGGDGGPATKASLADPAGVAVDKSGNVYIADGLNNRVRKVDKAGIITTVAGNGQSQFSGDGGPATSAGVGEPCGLALDAAGNLYIADLANQRIRKVDGSGVITTVAGGGGQECLPQGQTAAIGPVFKLPRQLVVDGGGNLYVADQWCSTILKVAPDGRIATVAGSFGGFAGDGGPATSARLGKPWGVALDASGNVYIGDTMNQRIRKVDASGIITTFAGSASTNFSGDGAPAISATLDYPYTVALDQAGSLYIADTNNNRIRKVTPAGTISTLAGAGTPGYSGDGGPAAQATLNSPQGVAVDPTGNVYIADQNNHRVRRVAPNGIITTVAGNGQTAFSGDGGPAAQAALNYPQGLALDAAGNLYVADRQNYRVRRVTPSGLITTVAGNGNNGFSGDGGTAVNASLGEATAVAVDSAGSLYIADWTNFRVRKVDPRGVITTMAGTGAGNWAGQDGVPATQIPMDQPVGVTADASGNVYIAATGSGTVTRVDPNGLGTRLVNQTTYQSFGGDAGPALLAFLNEPWGLVVDTRRNLYIADSGNDRIRQVTNVNSAQQLGLSNHGFGFNLTTGQDGGSRTVDITNLGTGTLTWSAAVQTSDGSDWLTVSPSSGVATATLIAASHTKAMPPGTYQATITITAPGASNSPQFLTVPLYVAAAAGPVITRVVNGATFQPGVVSGSWVTIQGSNLSGVTRSWNASDFTNGSALPTSLSGVQVNFNGIPAAVYYVSPSQLNVQAPANLTDAVSVQVQYLAASNSVVTNAVPSSPGLFTYSAGSSTFPAALYNGSAVLVGDPAVSGSAARKALAGDIIQLYATGLGPSLAGTTLDVSIPFPDALAVKIGSQSATVLGAALVYPGEFQINVVVPNLPAGNYPLTVSVSGQGSQAGVTIPIRE